MAKWREKVITAKGLEFISKAHLGAKINFTRLVTGDGDHYDADDTPILLDRILNFKQDANISELKIVGGNTVNIRAVLSNLGLAEGYFVKEIGVMAICDDNPEEEILYSVAIAEKDRWDYWPEFEITEVRMPISASLATGNSSNVTVEIKRDVNADEITFDDSRMQFGATSVQEAIEALTLNVLSQMPKTVVSEDMPEEPWDLWLKPMGGRSISGNLGGVEEGLPQPIYMTEMVISEEPPDDNSKIWIKPVDL